MQKGIVVMGIGAALSRHVAYPLWAKKDRSNVLAYLDQFEHSQFYSLDEIRNYQLERVKAIFNHAYENCPFYYGSFNKAGLHPDGISGLDDISQFPILEKTDIQERLDDLLARNIAKEDMIENRTGGSTGSPLLFYHNRERMESRAAGTIRHDRWAGWDIGKWKAVIWGAVRDIQSVGSTRAKLRNLLLDRTLWLDASIITEDSMRQFVDVLHRYRPALILGYANSLYLFARYLEKHGLDIPPPEGIISTAEVLNDESRTVIERCMGAKVFNRHGCREVGLIASECSKHEGMHINCESLYVEFWKDGRPALPGETAEILITDLWNTAMPFIRYRIKDIAVLSERQCSCSRGLPTMKTVAGRDCDFIRATNGAKVSGVGVSTYFIAKMTAVEQMQVIQDKPNHLLYKVVRSSSFSENDIKTIGIKNAEFFGEDMSYDVEYVESIPLESSGKHRVTICQI